jgi:hypothetical protein
MLDGWQVETDPSSYRVVACVDVLDKVKVRECEYDGGVKTSLWNARVQIRTVEAHTGIELARVMHDLRHDTSNVVSHGCPMQLDPSEATEKLPSYRRELAAIVRPFSGSSGAEQTSSAIDHLGGVRAR